MASKGALSPLYNLTCNTQGACQPRRGSSHLIRLPVDWLVGARPHVPQYWKRIRKFTMLSRYRRAQSDGSCGRGWSNTAIFMLPLAWPCHKQTLSASSSLSALCPDTSVAGPCITLHTQGSGAVSIFLPHITELQGRCMLFLWSKMSPIPFLLFPSYLCPQLPALLCHKSPCTALRISQESVGASKLSSPVTLSQDLH